MALASERDREKRNPRKHVQGSIAARPAEAAAAAAAHTKTLIIAHSCCYAMTHTL